MTNPHVLLLGGHGKIALLLTPKLLAKSWTVTSVIRNQAHEPDIRALAGEKPGKLDVLVNSLEDIKSTAQAAAVIGNLKPDFVVWSAGAGGGTTPDRTYAVDRDAAKYYISAAAESTSVKKFLLVSYDSSRRNHAPWWTEATKSSSNKFNESIAPHYFRAKIDADEHLLVKAKEVRDNGKEFWDICLRPGYLNDEPTTGKTGLGKVQGGDVPREDVAEVAARLLEYDYRGWLDMAKGDEKIGDAIEKAVRDQVDCLGNEDLQSIYSRDTKLA